MGAALVQWIKIKQGHDRPCFSFDLSLQAGRCPDPLCFVNKKPSKSEGKFPIFGKGIPHFQKVTLFIETEASGGSSRPLKRPPDGERNFSPGRCPDPPSPGGRKGTRCPFPSDRVIRVISSRAARMLTHPACCPLTPFPPLSENISRSAVC